MARLLTKGNPMVKKIYLYTILDILHACLGITIVFVFVQQHRKICMII
jgi:hypothetical protein